MRFPRYKGFLVFSLQILADNLDENSDRVIYFGEYRGSHN